MSQSMDTTKIGFVNDQDKGTNVTRFGVQIMIARDSMRANLRVLTANAM